VEHDLLKLPPSCCEAGSSTWKLSIPPGHTSCTKLYMFSETVPWPGREGLARFAAPTQSLTRITLFKGERSLRLSRQERARATERTCQLFCRACTLPRTRSILRLTVCWVADSLPPLSRKYLSNVSNSFRVFQRALFSLLRLYAFFSFVLPVDIHITDLIDDFSQPYLRLDLSKAVRVQNWIPTLSKD
jgi:hypothetical protein